MRKKRSDIVMEVINAIVSPRRSEITDVTKKIRLNNRF
jgi:hypothetical protein